MENTFNLSGRTALLVGPFTSTVQSLMMGLTQAGCDVVFLSRDNSMSQRFCSQLNDQREVNAKFGRCMGLQNPLMTVEDVKEGVSSAAQYFGSVDLFIDAQVFNDPDAYVIGEDLKHLDEEITRNFKSSVWLSHAVLNFFKTRKRGRILYLMNENYADPVLAGARGALWPFAQSLAKKVAEHNVTVNVLRLGLTEEFILAQYPGKSIKEALASLKEKDPSIKITEPEKVTNTVMYLVSPYGAALNGQSISLT